MQPSRGCIPTFYRMLNLYGTPAQSRRNRCSTCPVAMLNLARNTHSNLWISDTFFEQYNAWSYHINNFRSHLGLHLLLMSYQYEQKPFDIIDINNFQSSKGAHKVFFDTFAEDASLYLIRRAYICVSALRSIVYTIRIVPVWLLMNNYSACSVGLSFRFYKSTVQRTLHQLTLFHDSLDITYRIRRTYCGSNPLTYS